MKSYHSNSRTALFHHQSTASAKRGMNGFHRLQFGPSRGQWHFSSTKQSRQLIIPLLVRRCFYSMEVKGNLGIYTSYLLHLSLLSSSVFLYSAFIDCLPANFTNTAAATPTTRRRRRGRCSGDITVSRRMGQGQELGPGATSKGPSRCVPDLW